MSSRFAPLVMGSASPTAPFNISIIFIKEEINLGLPVFAGARELNKQGRRNEANKIGEMEFGRVRGAEPITNNKEKKKQPKQLNSTPTTLHCEIKKFISSFGLFGFIDCCLKRLKLKRY